MTAYGPQLPSAADVEAAYQAAVGATNPAPPPVAYQEWFQTERAYLAAHPESEPGTTLPGGRPAAPEVTTAELDLIREEFCAGLPTPDIYEHADVAIWRAEHAAELHEPEAGQ
jgi:hypothetical protein